MIVIPAELIDAHEDDEPEWLAALPALVDDYTARWELTRTGAVLNGAASLIVPVVRTDGTAAMLKLQPTNDENFHEALALRTWQPDDVVGVLEDDPDTTTILLERLHPRMLSDLPDHVEATKILAELLGRLSAVPAPAELRRLSDLAAELVEDAPGLIPDLADPAEQKLIQRFADQVRELIPEAGDRLLHWDLHYDNVMAADRQPWIVIDPKPLAGDPAFELFPALNNRWADLRGTGDLHQAIRDRFDLMLDVTGIPRDRALAWTAGRILQNVLWDLEDEESEIDPVQREIAAALRLG
ncbi:aminoglycoside phosphotransferase family protein [Kribbella sandramycini]|uniref:Streptomycin 6-kinase n=1 Tax=Kribbella sandramycini TaxID=60450 RepID=A0A841S4D5_9ACTN|nr:streptomycin 6-kinase [Kribbella sandramycini]